MRDFLAATRERVVVFDGSMGATLEQYDLSLEDDYGLPGRCHEALVLNRPDVIEQLHASMIEAGAEVVETDTFQGSRLKLDEWGLGEHTLELNRRAAAIARKAVGEQHFVAGSIGPTGLLPASDDPTPGHVRLRALLGIVGGCCGTTTEHIRAIKERCTHHTPKARPAKRPPHVSSMMTATPLAQEPAPTLVGERVNSQGSRKAKELLLADDYDGLVA